MIQIPACEPIYEDFSRKTSYLLPLFEFCWWRAIEALGHLFLHHIGMLIVHCVKGCREDKQYDHGRLTCVRVTLIHLPLLRPDCEASLMLANVMWLDFSCRLPLLLILSIIVYIHGKSRVQKGEFHYFDVCFFSSPEWKTQTFHSFRALS